MKGRGFPKFKNKNRFKSFIYLQSKQFDLKETEVRLPKIGWIRIITSRPYSTAFVPKQLRIARKATGLLFLD